MSLAARHIYTHGCHVISHQLYATCRHLCVCISHRQQSDQAGSNQAAYTRHSACYNFIYMQEIIVYKKIAVYMDSARQSQEMLTKVLTSI